MTLDECKMVLAEAAVGDGRIRALSPDDAQALAIRWGRHLFDVPFEFARSYVDRHYRNPDAAEVKSGHLLAAWRAAQRLEEAREPVNSRARVEGAVANLGDRPAWFDAYKAACDSAANWPMVYAISDPKVRKQEIRAARQRVSSVPVPVELVPDGNARERRCVNHDICACPHEFCRDGWLEAQVHTSGAHLQAYVGVQRCPACEDAVQMRGELKPSKGRKARR